MGCTPGPELGVQLRQAFEAQVSAETASSYRIRQLDEHAELVVAEREAGFADVHDGDGRAGDEGELDHAEANGTGADHEDEVVFFGLGALDGVIESGLRQQAVWQSGQRIIVGQPGEIGFGLFQPRDVGDNADVMARTPGLVADDAGRQPLWEHLAIVPPAPDLALPVTGIGETVPRGREPWVAALDVSAASQNYAGNDCHCFILEG